MDQIQLDENSISFVVFFNMLIKKELCQAKNVKIPPAMLLNLERREPTMSLSYDDLQDLDEELIQALLFSIAVFIKGNPVFIKELIIDSINIPATLMNTYSVALQVFF